MAKLPAFAIVADIGGTNARFSRVDLATLALDKVAVYPCADFATLADAVATDNLSNHIFDQDAC